MSNKEKVIEFLNSNHGYITTAEFLTLGMSKPLIQKFLDEGLIERVSYGLYMDSKILKDEYFILQKKYPLAIFSYNTALHILNLTNIGIIKALSPSGNPVKIYNAERCICDMLRTEGEFDLELQNRVLDYYFHSKDKDVDKLLEYAKVFNIYDKVNTIVEVMMKW